MQQTWLDVASVAASCPVPNGDNEQAIVYTLSLRVIRSCRQSISWCSASLEIISHHGPLLRKISLPRLPTSTIATITDQPLTSADTSPFNQLHEIYRYLLSSIPQNTSTKLFAKSLLDDGLLHEPIPHHYLPSQTSEQAFLEMRNTPPPKDFEIHVDPSCLSNRTHAQEDTKNESAIHEDDTHADRVSSNQTIVHHDSWSELKAEADATAGQNNSEVSQNGSHKENIPAAHVEPHKATVEDVEDEGESSQQQTTHELEIEAEKERLARERQIDRIEAQIQAAARAVVASIEHDNYRGTDSELSMQTDESYDREGTEMTYGSECTYQEGTELTYGDETEATYESDHSLHDEPEVRYESDHIEHDGGDSSSHHDGDVDDDVFSNSDRSKRSSLNSDMHSDDNQKVLTSPVVGEEAGSNEEVVSRIPSASSYMQTQAEMTPKTPSRVLARPPFRTPSSVRAMQMSSPTQSVFASPRSVKRHLPTVSRIGTPNSQYSPSKRTPTRSKFKKEQPLVLLHVTVLPLQWPYSHLMTSADVPDSLHRVKDSWRLLQEKLGDTVLERGVLLPHPQDSYEVLEERLLEALELPVRPRAKILKCGHYMGPTDADIPTSDDESGEDTMRRSSILERKWCDICRRDVRVELVGDVGKGERRFRVKIYASNGLMRAGAWAAAWKEMERVDVELEPFVESHLTADLEHLALIIPDHSSEQETSLDDGFVDEDLAIEHAHDHSATENQHEEAARLRDEAFRLHEEEQMQKQKALEEELRQRMVEEEDMMRRKAIEEERMREIYGNETPEPAPSQRTSSRLSVHDDSSLSDLLLAAFKVAMRDSKNLVIGGLSILVLLLALWPKSTPQVAHSAIMPTSHPIAHATPVVASALATEAESVSAAIQSVVQMAESLVELESVAPLTTTVVREVTVTERVPAATPNGMEGRREPCEDVMGSGGSVVGEEMLAKLREEARGIPTPPAAIREGDF